MGNNQPSFKKGIIYLIIVIVIIAIGFSLIGKNGTTSNKQSNIENVRIHISNT